MKERILFAVIAGMGLVSASQPASTPNSAGDMAYPACSRTVTDHCIQLYERGVRTQDNLAANRIEMAPQAQVPESGGAGTAAADDLPPCTADVTDDCEQRPARLTTRARRAGERG